MKILLSNKIRICLLCFILSFASCSFIRSNYHNDFQTKAERYNNLVVNLYNEQNFNEIYELFGKDERLSRDEFIGIIKNKYEKFGKILNITLDEAKVLDYPPSPMTVIFAYKFEYERGNNLEMISWERIDEKMILFDWKIISTYEKL